MSCFFIATHTDHFVALRKAGLSCCMQDDIASADFSTDDVVVVANGAEAKTLALDLASRGVPTIKLSYVDLGKNDNLIERCKSPKHLYWDDVVPVSQLDVEDDFPVYPSGIPCLDKNLSWGWRIPELVVMAGPYGCGKSTLGQILAANFVHNAGRKLNSGAMLCSWEDLDSEVKRNTRNFARAKKAPDVVDKVHFVRRKASAERLMSWYIDLVKYHRRRYGTRFHFLDPWNEMDHQKDSRQIETDYVKDMMRILRDVVDEEEIILVIATHISAKYLKGDGSIEPFKIGHAQGSANFANKADRGICLVRTKKFEQTRGHAIIRLDKSKIERKMGKRGTVACRLNEDTFDFEYDAYATQEVKDVWKD